MKKSLLILLLALFVVNFVYSEYVSLDNKAYLPYEVNVISQTSNEVIVEFKLNSFEVNKITIKGKEYSKINIPGVVNYLEKGKPELPHINRNVIISDAGKTTFKVIDSEIVTREFLPPVPSKGNLLRNIDPSTVPYSFAKDYHLAAFPPIYIKISEPFIMRKFRGTNISFSPIIYNPKNSNYTVYKRIVVSIKTIASEGINEISRTDLALKIDKDFENIYRSNFINYSEILNRYPVVTEQGKMLIITDDGFYNTMMPFYLWKLKKGIPCEMVNLSTIGNNETAIKNFIQTKFDSDTIAYILLVGDAEDVTPGTGTIGDANREDADPVYTYLAGSDYYPDAIIGRFSSSNVTDIGNMVNRSIEYEMNPDPTGTWYHKAAGVSSNEGSPSDEERITWEKDTLLAHNTYESVDILVQGQSNLQANISAAFNEGRGLGYYIGHGSVTSWSSVGYTTNHVQALTNVDMLPVIHTVACVSGKFAGATCFAEKWLIVGTADNPTGAISHYASTIDQSWVPPCVSQMEFIRLLANNLNTSVGALFFNGSCEMIEYYGATSAEGVELFQTWIIFGDPSIQIRTNTPLSMTANYDNTLIVGQSTYLDVSTPGTSNALCGVYNPGDSTLIGYGYTDGSGNVTLNLDPVPLVPGQLILTITAFNKIPIVDTIDVISPSGPFVTYLSNIIDDASGNNNGQINPGETIDLSVYLKNVGVADAHSVYALVSTTDPDVTVNADSSNYGDIAAGDSALSITDYNFTVGTVNNEHIIPFDILITATETTWTGSFSLMVYAPVVSQETFTIDDATTGNNSGKWDAGEQVKILFGVKNSGGELAKNVNINITTSTGGITIDDGSAIFGDIDTSTTVINTADDLLATSSASIPTGTEVAIDYTISGDNFTDITGSVSTIVGQSHYIIFDVDENHNSGSVMHTVLTNLGYQGDYYTTFSPMVDSLTNYASAFVFAGIYSYNQRIYPDTGAKFANYCQNDGGKFYLEGGDVWYWDPIYGGYNFESLCGIDGTTDGSGDLATIGGVATTFTEGMSFSYSGDNSYIDHLSPTGTGYTIFNNSSPAYVCGIASDTRAYRTVGFSFEFGGLTNGSGVSTKDTLALNIMEFFGIHLQGVAIDRFSALKSNRTLSFGIKAKGSNLFSNKLNIEYGIVHSGKVEIEIYNTTGRKIKTLVNTTENAGYHKISWNGTDDSGKNLVNGIYFVTIKSAGKVKNTKVMLIK